MLGNEAEGWALQMGTALTHPSQIRLLTSNRTMSPPASHKSPTSLRAVPEEGLNPSQETGWACSRQAARAPDTHWGVEILDEPHGPEREESSLPRSLPAAWPSPTLPRGQAQLLALAWPYYSSSLSNTASGAQPAFKEVGEGSPALLQVTGPSLVIA